jgi:hypothetical protein
LGATGAGLGTTAAGTGLGTTAAGTGLGTTAAGTGLGATGAGLTTGGAGAAGMGGGTGLTAGLNTGLTGGLTTGGAGLASMGGGTGLTAGLNTGLAAGGALTAGGAGLASMGGGTGLTTAAAGGGILGAGGVTGAGTTLGSGVGSALTGAGAGASSLVQQLQAATGLSGPQLAALLSGGVGAANSANLSSAINTGLDATIAANTASQGTLKDIYNQQLGFQKPYQQTGLTGLNQLNQLADTGYLTHQFNAQDLAAGLAPNYDFMLQQGQMANQRAANVGGGALSGNTLQGLQNYTQNYAGNAYQNAFNNYQTQRQNIYTNLAGMAGIGQTANTGAQAAGTAYGKGTTDLQTALANAQAAAAIGKAQAVAGGTSGLANSTFLASLLGQTGTVPT